MQYHIPKGKKTYQFNSSRIMTVHKQNMLFANKCLQIAGSLMLSFQNKANIFNVIIKMYENTPVDFFNGRKCQGFLHQLMRAALNLEVKLRTGFLWENQEVARGFFPALCFGPTEGLGLVGNRVLEFYQHGGGAHDKEGWPPPGSVLGWKEITVRQRDQEDPGKRRKIRVRGDD